MPSKSIVQGYEMNTVFSHKFKAKDKYATVPGLVHLLRNFCTLTVQVVRKYVTVNSL
jgi:hypothetical protein